MLDDYNKSNQPVSPTVSSTTPTTTPTNKTPGGEDPFSEASRLNRTISGLEAGATLGMGLYNLATKYKAGPKPLEYTPDIKERDFMGLENQLDKATALAANTSRYNARNVNQTEATNAAIHANELGQLSKNAAIVHDAQEQDKLRINAQKNEANLYNLANTNQYNANEAQQLNNFRLQKGQVISNNISTLGAIGKDYVSNKILIDTAKKGTQIDVLASDYNKWNNETSLKTDSNNPIVKRDANGNIIYRKKPDGTTDTIPEYYTFAEFALKNKL
jgi:hypothetical protein